MAGIGSIEKARTDAIFPHRSNAMREDEPTIGSFDRRSTVAELCEFPCPLRVYDPDAPVPVMQVLGQQKPNILIVVPAEHRVTALDQAGKQRHSLRGGDRSLEPVHLEVDEVSGGEQLLGDSSSPDRRVGPCKQCRPVLQFEAGEPKILNAAALPLEDREEDCLRQVVTVFAMKTHRTIIVLGIFD